MSIDIQYLSKEDFIKNHQNHWEKTGEIYKKARIANKLTRREVCAILQISEGKLCSFEHGNPVREVKLLKAALKLIYKEMDQKSFHKILQCERVIDYLTNKKSGLLEAFYNETYKNEKISAVSSTFGQSTEPVIFGSLNFGS